MLPPRDSSRVKRERAVADLNDCLVQDVQGLLLRFQAAADRIPAEHPARALMEEALDRADQVLAQVRERARALIDTIPLEPGN